MSEHMEKESRKQTEIYEKKSRELTLKNTNQLKNIKKKIKDDKKKRIAKEKRNEKIREEYIRDTQNKMAEEKLKAREVKQEYDIRKSIIQEENLN